MAKARKKNAGFKNAIKSADFRPRRLTAQPDEVRKLHLGTLLGEASATFFQPDINDPTNTDKMQEGITGAFQFTDAIDGDVMRGPRLWVPDTIADGIKTALRTIDKETGEVTAHNAKVQFGYEVYAVRSSAPLGYTWEFVPVFEEEASENDPIQALMKRKAAAEAALPAPEEAPQIEAPKAKGAKAA